ncbi:hypothetical protein BH18ACT6_BH18ACT6_13120 [soil metagenome]
MAPALAVNLGVVASRQLLALCTLAVVTGLALPTFATTTTAATGTTGGTATTVAGGGVATTVVGETTTTAEPIVPAVSTEVTEPEETQPDWTYRFFIPTLLLVAAVVVILTVVRYFTGVVRKRYRVVR